MLKRLFSMIALFVLLYSHRLYAVEFVAVFPFQMDRAKHSCQARKVGAQDSIVGARKPKTGTAPVIADSLRLKATDQKKRTIELKEVGIKTRAIPVSNTSNSTALTTRQLENSKGNTLAEVLKDIAGVSVLKTGATISKPVIHGLHSNRILILNNGVRLEGQQWGAEHAPEIDPFVAGSMHVVKGAESVRYGAEAIGGVVLVIPPELPESASIGGSIDLIGATNGRAGTSSAMLNGGLKQLPGFGWRVQGTLKKAGNVRSAAYILGNTGVRELNYAAAMGYVTDRAAYEAYYSQFSTELGILYSAHAGTKEDIEARIAAGRPAENYDFTYLITAPRQRIFHDLLKLKARYRLGPEKSFNVTYGYQRNHRKEFDFRRGDREALPITDLVLNTHTLDLNLEQQSENGSKSIYGFNGLGQVNNNIPGTLANTFIPNYDSYTGGIYFIRRWVKDAFELEAGLRYDFKIFDAAGFRYQYGATEEEGVQANYYGGLSRFHNITGTIGGLWKLNNFWHLSSNAGLAWRAPTANELFSNGLHHGAGLYEIGDANLKTEQGYKWISSVKHFSDAFNFKADVYAQYLHNYIYTQPDGSFRQTVSGTYPIFRYLQTNASMIGADLSGSYRFLPFLTYQLNVAVVRGWDLSKKQYLPDVPSDRADHNLRLDQHLKIHDLWLQLGHSFVRRQTRYASNTDYAAPPAAYHLVQLSAGSKFRFGANTLGVSLSADNLFNTAYKEYMNRYRYYTHDLGRNITLRLAYKF